MKKWIILFVTIMVAASATGCGNEGEIVQLRKEIASVRDDVEELKASEDQAEDKKDDEAKEAKEETVVENINSQTTNAYQEFIELQFPKDGKTYVVSKYSAEGQKFYSDINCTVEITEPEFCSKNIQSGTAANTLSVYCFRTTADTIVYSPKKPSNLVDKAEQQ